MEEIIVAFLDVGQGDCAIITLPDKKTGVIIDCRSWVSAKHYLELRNIEHVRYIFLTHSDLDHANGIINLLANYAEIGTHFFYNNDSLLLLQDGTARDLIRRKIMSMIDLGGLIAHHPRVGHDRSLQNVKFDILHPSDNDVAIAFGSGKHGNPNAMSLLIRLTYAQKRVLFTADINEKGWKCILDRDTDLDADVLKFPHHGAWYQTQDAHNLSNVIAKINPQLTILSVGTSNPYKHPRQEVFELLRKHKFPMRFICTQATKQCHNTLQNPQSCAGNIEVTINQNGELTVTPSSDDHELTINTFDSPMCR